MRAVAGAVAWRAMHNYFTTPALLVPSLVFPLIFLAAFAGGLSALGGVPGFEFPAGYTAFQFVFVLLQAAAFGGVFGAFTVASDFERGIGRRLMLSAPNRLGILAGYVLAALARVVFTMAVVTAVALAAGMRITGNGVDLVALYTLALIVNLAAFTWASGVALRVRSIQGGPLMQTPVFLILFLAPVYVPLDLLDGWLRTVAGLNPATALLEAGRGFISGRHQLSLVAFACALGLAAGFSLWAVRGLRAAERAGA